MRCERCDHGLEVMLVPPRVRTAYALYGRVCFDAGRCRSLRAWETGEYGYSEQFQNPYQDPVCPAATDCDGDCRGAVFVDRDEEHRCLVQQPHRPRCECTAEPDNGASGEQPV